MDELRDKIALVITHEFPSIPNLALEMADEILDISEIKTALAYAPRAGGYRNIVTKEGGTQFVSTKP